MREAEILLNDVSLLRYLFVSLFFVVRQLCGGSLVPHDTVRDLVHTEKDPVRFAKVPFIGIYLLNGVLGMTTACDTEREIGVIIMRSRGYLSGKNKPLPGIDGGMFLEPEVRDVILDRPVGFKVPGEFKRIAVLVHSTLRGQSFLSSFSFSVLTGWLADWTRRASMAMPSFMGNPLAANCKRSSWLIRRMVSLDNLPLKREKVE